MIASSWKVNCNAPSIPSWKHKVIFNHSPPCQHLQQIAANFNAVIPYAFRCIGIPFFEVLNITVYISHCFLPTLWICISILQLEPLAWCYSISICIKSYLKKNILYRTYTQGYSVTPAAKLVFHPPIFAICGPRRISTPGRSAAVDCWRTRPGEVRQSFQLGKAHWKKNTA